MDIIFSWIAQYGYVALFGLLMLGIVGLPIPDETLLTFVGYLVFKHELAPIPAALAAISGSLCGITLSYGLGRSFGPYLVLHVGHLFGSQPQDLDRVRAWYGRWGKYALAVGYFVPGLRHFVALVAGSSKLPLRVFVPFAYTGGLLWSMTFLSLGYGLGEEWAHTSATLHRFLMFATGIIITLIIVVFTVRKRTSRLQSR